jgi:hypothetical protein
MVMPFAACATPAAGDEDEKVERLDRWEDLSLFKKASSICRHKIPLHSRMAGCEYRVRSLLLPPTHPICPPQNMHIDNRRMGAKKGLS